MIRLHAKSELDLRNIGSKLKDIRRRVSNQGADELAKMIKSNLESGYIKPPLGADEKWQWLSDEYWKNIGSPSPAAHPGMVMTTNLINSIRVRMINDTTFEVEVDNEYAARLEYGDVGISLPPRPYAEPAVHFFEQTEVISEIVEDELMKVFG